MNCEAITNPITKTKISVSNRALPLLCLLAAVLCTNVSNAQNPAFRHIPPDADNVFHINLSALGSKLSWDEISGMIPAPKSQSDQDIMKFVKDPALTGVDFQKGLLGASGHLGKNADSPSIVTIIISLTDSGKLLSLLRKENGVRTFKFPGKAAVVGKDKMALAYDDKLAVFTLIDPESKVIKSTPVTPGGTKKMVSPYYTMLAARKSMEAFTGYTTSTYITDPVFVNGFSDDADFHIWSSPGSFFTRLMEMSKKKGPFAGGNMPKPPATGTHMLSAFRFDVGKITLRTTIPVPPDSAKIHSIFNGHPLNTDLITHLPGKTVLGMFNIHVDPAGLNFLLEHYHTKHMIDSMMQKSGLSIDDFLKALKGDILIAAMEPSEKPESGGFKPDIFFAVTIGDMGAFMKITSKLGLNKDSAGGMLEKMKAGFTLKNNILVVGPKGKTDAFFTTNNPGNLNLVDNLVKDNAFSVVVDIKSIVASLKASEAGSTQKMQQMLHFIGALDRLTYAAGNYKDGKSEYYFELKMTDTSNNSLRALFNLLH